MEDVATSTADRLSAYRTARKEIEQAILPLATSIDGRNFQFQASLHGLMFRAGGYVVLEADQGSLLGQVLAVSLHRADPEQRGIGGDRPRGGGARRYGRGNRSQRRVPPVP